MKNFIINHAGIVPMLQVFATTSMLLLVSCSKETDLNVSQVSVPEIAISSEQESIARMLASQPIGIEQVKEVYAAVSSSSLNGYDEEYTFSSMFTNPGSGVGDERLQTKSDVKWERPLASFLSSATKAPAINLQNTNLQVYWPYSEDWDGTSMPVITFNGDRDSDSVSAFILGSSDDPSQLQEILIDEDYAKTHPVWVINENDDASGLTPQMAAKLRALSDSDLASSTFTDGASSKLTDGTSQNLDPETRASYSSLKTLSIKEFKAHRNYDSWLAGASEFFIKCGCIEGFSAGTTDDLKLYEPSVTDLMIVVKRKYIGTAIRYNAVLVSEWTDQLENCAFMIIEDDGGTVKTWKCNGTVKIKSKSYGFDVEFPFHRNDDIVWRGPLSHDFFEKNNQVARRFGDVSVTFKID